jgi:serine protease Do
LYGIASGNEPASLLQGFVSAVAPLTARRGVYQTPYDGPVYVLDAMTNNAGAAGGALTDAEGNLAAILGKELRSSRTNLWLNYAIPISELRSAVEDIVAGKLRRRAETTDRRPADSVSLTALGIVTLPPVIPKTPPYVERIIPTSPAEEAGMLPDDLIVLVNGSVIQSIQELSEELSYIDRLDAVRLTVMRAEALVEVELVVRP